MAASRKAPANKRVTLETAKGILNLLERRVVIRHQTAVECEVRALESSTWAETQLVNLSNTGARFQGVLITIPGALVVIRIPLTEVGKVYEFYGVVVWRNKGSFGVQFL